MGQEGKRATVFSFVIVFHDTHPFDLRQAERPACIMSGSRSNGRLAYTHIGVLFKCD
nr:MAG TPA_asm: hypothetical protein [Caudoviricetes sp.]